MDVRTKDVRPSRASTESSARSPSLWQRQSHPVSASASGRRSEERGELFGFRRRPRRGWLRDQRPQTSGHVGATQRIPRRGGGKLEPSEALTDRAIQLIDPDREARGRGRPDRRLGDEDGMSRDPGRLTHRVDRPSRAAAACGPSAPSSSSGLSVPAESSTLTWVNRIGSGAGTEAASMPPDGSVRVACEESIRRPVMRKCP